MYECITGSTATGWKRPCNRVLQRLYDSCSTRKIGPTKGVKLVAKLRDSKCGCAFLSNILPAAVLADNDGDWKIEFDNLLIRIRARKKDILGENDCVKLAMTIPMIYEPIIEAQGQRENHGQREDRRRV